MTVQTDSTLLENIKKPQKYQNHLTKATDFENSCQRKKKENIRSISVDYSTMKSENWKPESPTLEKWLT